jgi:hypothetical protein
VSEEVPPLGTKARVDYFREKEKEAWYAWLDQTEKVAEAEEAAIQGKVSLPVVE